MRQCLSIPMNHDLTCESCQSAPAVLEVADISDPGRPFRVCSECERRLQALALRPLEWFRLAALHGWGSYLLCDDFYDDDGARMQLEKR